MEMSPCRFHSCRLIRAAFVFALAHSASFIVVPPHDVQTYRRERAAGDRRLIVESVREYQTRREQFSEAIPCIERFLIKSIQEPSRSILLILDDNEGINEIAYPLITSVKGRFAFFTHAADGHFDVPQDIATSAVVLMSNGSSVEESFYVLTPCDRGCTYVAVLVTKFEDEESFLLDAEVLAQSMWTRRISILAVLARVRDTVLVAGSLKFEPDKLCVPSPPVILDRCDGDGWKNSTKIAIPELNHCVIKVAYFERAPYVFTVNGSEYLSGFEGNLTEELTRGLRVERQRAEMDENTTSAKQTELLLFEDDDSRVDLVVGRVLQQSQKKVGYSTTYDVLQLVWVVPKVPNVSLQGLIHPFSTYVWAAIAGTLLLGGVIKVLIIRDVSWLDIFSLIIGVSIVRRPTRISGRIHFIVWCLFGLFLAQFYVDSLSDQLINHANLKFTTMEELISSSFQIGGTVEFAKLVEQFEQTEIIAQIRNKFVTFDRDDYKQQFDDLLAGRNASFALVVVLNSSRSDAIQTAHAYTLISDVICSFPLALATWKGFPYLRIVNIRIQEFIDSGIFAFMINQATATERRTNMLANAMKEEYEKELHLKQFVPAFLLMVIGYSSGLLFLILEILLYPRRILEGGAEEHRGKLVPLAGALTRCRVVRVTR